MADRMKPFKASWVNLDFSLEQELLWPKNHRTNNTPFSEFNLLVDAIKNPALKPSIFQFSHTFPGIDAAIVCTDSAQEVWCLLLEMKFSTKDSSTVHLLSELIENKLRIQAEKKYASLLRNASSRNCHVLSVFTMWHILPLGLHDVNPWKKVVACTGISETDFSDAILILGRKQLSQFYVSLSPLAEYAFGGDHKRESDNQSSVNMTRLLFSCCCAWLNC